jgi:hypothetical protein
MAFFLTAIVFMYVGRKIGWLYSRAALYPTPLAPCAVLCVIWGLAVAGSMYGLISWLQPGTILRWLMGYALGSYVSVPNYGLFDESTIPESARSKHNLISALPPLVYVLALVLLAYAVPFISQHT